MVPDQLVDSDWTLNVRAVAAHEGPPKDPMVWGGVGTRAGNIAGVLASIAALGVLRAKRLFELEHGRDRVAEARRTAERQRGRGAQACAWIMTELVGGAALRLTLRNVNELPVVIVEFQLTANTADCTSRKQALAVLPPANEPHLIPIIELLDDAAKESSVSMEFTDAAGIRSRRDDNGLPALIVAQMGGV